MIGPAWVCLFARARKPVHTKGAGAWIVPAGGEMHSVAAMQDAQINAGGSKACTA